MNKENYARFRNDMVQRQLRIRGIFDQDVLDVFSEVPREQFLDNAQKPFAYGDYPLPIGHHQTISQPFIVALMTQAINPNKSMKVLEIGTGSGYQTAIFSHLVDEVYTIERIESLQEKAKNVLDDLELNNIHYKTGNGKKGWAEHAPYDAIVVTAATNEVPEALSSQLADDGVMIIPLGGQFQQNLTKITKKDGTNKKVNLGPCRFVPLI